MPKDSPGRIPTLDGIRAVGIALVLIRLSALERRLNRVSRLEAKVDALLRHSGVEFDPFRDMPSDVQEALEALRD